MAGLSVYQTGDVLFREGDPGDRVFFITSGRVQVLKTLANGENSKMRSASVVALEPTEVMEVARENFLASMEQQPKLAINFLKLLANRIAQMDERWKDALADTGH